jgi:hypothetical protein
MTSVAREMWLCVSVPSTELCLHCVMPLNIIICANAIAAIKLIVSTIGAQFCTWFRDEMDKFVGLRVLFAICQMQ